MNAAHVTQNNTVYDANLIRFACYTVSLRHACAQARPA
jgi:hypothetical protein